MPGIVVVKITAEDDATKEIEQINVTLEELGETAKETSEKAKDTGEKIKGVGEEVDGLGKKTEEAIPSIRKLMEVEQIKKFKDAAVKAFGEVADAIKGMVNEYMNYAEQVNDLSRLTGISAESASRLIQITDDVRISYETMNTAMQAATRQGIDVSVEGLMRLSDQYLALQPGLERSEWLLKTFGRSGAEMGQLMEVGSQGIKAMNDEVAKGLILNEQNIQDMEAAKLAYDNFEDSIANVKYKIVAELIPAFNSLPEPLKNVTSGLIAFGPQIGGTISTIADLTIAFQGLGVLFKKGGLLAGAGTMLASLKGAAVALGLAAAPVLALAGAIAVLIGLLRSQVGQEAINTLKQLAVIWAKMIYGNAGAQLAMNVTGLSGKAKGGDVYRGKPVVVGEEGMEVFIPPDNGTIVPNNRLVAAGGGGGSFVFNYSPTISTASRSEAEMVIKPMIENIVRSRYGK